MKKSLSPELVNLAFSEKYDQAHAQQYFEKHRQGLARRLTNWREQVIARKALQLAGNPKVVLDLPCGAGRFWELLTEDSERRILAADQSEDMIKIARKCQSPALVKRIKCFQTSAFDIDMKDKSVDCVFSMRLLHHIGDSAHRARLLKEFWRVSRDTVCVSLWVDGNYKAIRRKRLDLYRNQAQKNKYQNRFVFSRKEIEAEFRQAGFDIAGHYDLLKYYAMWRIYVLRKS